MTAVVRKYFPAAISLEAVAGAWVRQDEAPAGSMVELSSEIAGRIRNGPVWEPTHGAGVRLAAIARPALRQEHETLCWVAGITAAAIAAEGIRSWWPDRLVNANGDELGIVNVVAMGGLGRINAVIIAARWDLDRASVDQDSFVLESIRLLDLAASDPSALLAEHAIRSRLIGTRVRASLLPRGDMRGNAAELNAAGELVLLSPTGLRQHVTIAQLQRVDPV